MANEEHGHPVLGSESQGRCQGYSYYVHLSRGWSVKVDIYHSVPDTVGVIIVNGHLVHVHQSVSVSVKIIEYTCTECWDRIPTS